MAEPGSDADTSPADKPYPPTQKRLEDARRDGNIVRSNDLNTAVAYAGLVLAAAIWGGAALLDFGGALTFFFRAGLWNSVDLGDGGTSASVLPPLRAALLAMLPLLLLPGVLLALSLVAQRGFVFTGSNLEPKLSRLSILENAKKKFGRQGLFEFFKSTVKLCLFCGTLAAFIYAREPEIIQSALLDYRNVLLRLGELSMGFFLVALGIAMLLGGVDYLFQTVERLRGLRMSHKEMMDEVKNSEGDPFMRQARRQRGREYANVEMLRDVKDADVVVVNPEHYAVALKWSRAPGTAPVCVAKGVDALAATIRRLAAEAEVPIYRAPPTARILYATTPIGAEVTPEHYRAVAAAIRFAEAMREKRKHRPYGP